MRAKSTALESATNIRLLDANLYGWRTMSTTSGPPLVTKITARINQERYDFVAAQESTDQTNRRTLTDPAYGLSTDYRLAGNVENNAAIFYDASRWSLVDWRSAQMTADSASQRVAVVASFSNLATRKEVTIATTNLCVAWSGSTGCIGGEVQAHVNDAQSLGALVSIVAAPGSAVFVSGNFNTMQDGNNQALAIESKLQPFGLQAVKSNGAFIGPTFGPMTLDYVYTRDVTVVSSSLYTGAQGNPSDHAAIDVTVSVPDTCHE